MTATEGAAMRLIGIVGAGRMGRGIATAYVLAGHQVHLIDIRPRNRAAFAQLAADARGEVRANVAFLAHAGLVAPDRVDAICDRMTVFEAGAATTALAPCDPVFEAVPETIPAKTVALALIGDAVARDAVIASTTSTIDADALSALVVAPERFLNAHWLNPAHLVPLVEVSPSRTTAPDTIERLYATLQAVGKVPVTCRSSPGYIVPRIQALAMNEAARIVEEGVATAADVDTAVRMGFGFRFAILGLLEFIDWGGGDILHHASDYLARTLDPIRFAAPAIVTRNMREGRNGLRDGVGFYDYTAMDMTNYRADRLREFLTLLQHRGIAPVILDAPDPVAIPAVTIEK